MSILPVSYTHLQLTWYNNIGPNETVELVNTLWQRANAGETVFYDIYTCLLYTSLPHGLG